MRSVKAGPELVELIKLCYRSDRPLLLIGEHGIGKSEIAEQAAKEMGIEYICRDLSLMEPTDLVGLPQFQKTPLGGTYTHYAFPSFLPTTGKGLMVFEELNRCPGYMRAPCLQLLTARTLNDYRLPAGWLPIAAINPPSKDYEVNELDNALSSRFVKVNVIPSRKNWLEWARVNGMNENVINYVHSDAKIFDDTKPRDWAYVSSLLNSEKQSEEGNKLLNKSVMQIAIAGIVGRERALAFESFIKNGYSLPTIRSIIKDYNKYDKAVKGWVEKGETDKLDQVNYNLRVYLSNESNYKKLSKNKEWWENFKQLLLAIPPDMKEETLSFMKKRKYGIPLLEEDLPQKQK